MDPKVHEYRSRKYELWNEQNPDIDYSEQRIADKVATIPVKEEGLYCCGIIWNLVFNSEQCDQQSKC